MKALEQNNPYAAITASASDPNWLRISSDVSRTDVFTLYSVLMDRGALRIAVGMFVKHLADECKRNNWTVNAESRDQLINYIIRCTTSGPNGPRPDDALGQRASTVRKRNPRKTNIAAVSSGEQSTATAVDEVKERTDDDATGA